MCSFSCIQLERNPHFSLDYVDFDMDLTNEMWETANRVSFLVYGIPLGLFFLADVFKNVSFCFYNIGAYVINTVSSLLYRILQAVDEILGLSPAVAISCNISNDNLAAFRAAMKAVSERANHPVTQDRPIVAYLQDRQCAIWYDPDQDTVNIQDRSGREPLLIAMKMNSVGHVLSIQVNGASHDSLPSECEPYLWFGLQQAFMASSKYEDQPGGGLRIQLIREGLKEIPEYHLSELGQKLNQLGNINMRVRFLNCDLEEGDGIDAGGLRRDFLDDLFSGLFHGNQIFSFSRDAGGSLAMPVTTSRTMVNGIPTLSLEETVLLEYIGVIMAYCNQRPQELSIGRRFENGLFQAIFSLTGAEVDADHLPIEVQLKIMKTIFLARATDTIYPVASREYLNGFITAVDQWRPNQNNHDWAGLRERAENMAVDLDGVDVATLAGRQSLIQKLREYLPETFQQMYGKYVRPIHAIAKGIKAMRTQMGENWADVQWEPFKNNVQGSLDRTFIAARIDTSGTTNAAILRKAGWLREWILANTTTDGQLEAFVKYATGSSTLPIGGRIRVISQLNDYLPFPKAHTCFSSIELSPRNASYGNHNDHTKEGFIRSLVEVALRNPNYQMG